MKRHRTKGVGKIKGTQRQVMVKFEGKGHVLTFVPDYKLHGGCGIHHLPEPYTGPRSRVVTKGTRQFVVTRMNRSPTGSAHGSFQIEEQVGEKFIVRGFHCSWPDEDTCLKIARDDEQHRRIGYHPRLFARSKRVSENG